MPSASQRAPSRRSGVMPARDAACAQRVLRRAIVDQAADRVVDDEELVDAGAAAIAGLVACAQPAGARTAASRGERRSRPAARLRPRWASARRAARGTKRAHEPLREHAEQARREQIRLDAHVGKARHRARRVVGVQRRQHEMAGERCLHRDLRGLEVADLADHDDVGILAQDRAQRAREVELDPRIDLRLRRRRRARTRSDPRPSSC